MRKIAPQERVSDDLEAEFITAFGQIEQINRAVWQKGKGPKQRMLDTSYGQLDIERREGFRVFRNGEPLVRFPRLTDKPALFLDERAAKAAVVCDTLEKAQTLAVYYARYSDDDRFRFYFWRTTPTAMSALELARQRRALRQAA